MASILSFLFKAFFVVALESAVCCAVPDGAVCPCGAVVTSVVGGCCAPLLLDLSVRENSLDSLIPE